MRLEKEFRTEVQKRNKFKFIEIVSKEFTNESTVDLPACIYAEKAYQAFKEHGLFDEYGFLKPVEEIA